MADYINGTYIVDVGDSTSSANTLTGDSSITGSVGYSDDTGDFYRFTAASSGTGTFNLS